MTLDKEFVEAYVADALDAFMSSEGFELNRELKQFRKTSAEGFQSLIYSVSAYEDAVLIEFHFGLRVDAIEDLVGRFTRSLPGWKEDAHSLILSQGKLFERPYWRFEAQTTEDLDVIVHGLQALWRQRAKEFLEESHSVSAIHKLLNTEPEKPTPYLPNQAHRCLRGLAAASLSQHQEMEDLIQTYSKVLREVPGGDSYMPGFERLVSYLRGISWN